MIVFSSTLCFLELNLSCSAPVFMGEKNNLGQMQVKPYGA